MYEYTVDPESGEYTEKELWSDLYLDFPRINDDYMGKPYRYAYAAQFYKPDGIFDFNLCNKIELSLKKKNRNGWIVVI